MNLRLDARGLDWPDNTNSLAHRTAHSAPADAPASPDNAAQPRVQDVAQRIA